MHRTEPRKRRSARVKSSWWQTISSPESVELGPSLPGRTRHSPAPVVGDRDAPGGKTISRIDYEQLIAGPLKDFLVEEKLTHVRCVVLMYGVPLKVLEPIASGEERKVEMFVRDERIRRMTELVDLVQKVHGLRGVTHTGEERALPAFDSQINASSQIRGLVDQLLGEFADTAGQGSGRSSGSEKGRPAPGRLVRVVAPSVRLYFTAGTGPGGKGSPADGSSRTPAAVRTGHERVSAAAARL